MIDKDSFTKCNISEIIEVIKGDIIELAINKKVDAIVNAAKPSLMGYVIDVVGPEIPYDKWEQIKLKVKGILA